MGRVRVRARRSPPRRRSRRPPLRHSPPARDQAPRGRVYPAANSPVVEAPTVRQVGGADGAIDGPGRGGKIAKSARPGGGRRRRQSSRITRALGGSAAPEKSQNPRAPAGL